MQPLADLQAVARVADSWIAIFVPVALKGSLLVGALLLAGRLLRSASAAARHLMWTLGMLGLLLLPILAAGLPSWQVVPLPGAIVSSAARTVSDRFDHANHPPIAAGEPARVSEPGRQGEPERMLGHGPVTALAGPREAGAAEFVRTAWNTLAAVSPATWGLSGWLGGMLPIALALVWGASRLGRLRREAEPPMTGGWHELVLELGRELRLTVTPVLLVSPRAIAPMTWGLRRAVVLLPADCHDWPADLRRQVLLHELAHVRRRDCLTQLIAHGACLLHWYNPLVWLAARAMRDERERACDDLVLATGARPSSYADHLLQIASRLGARERTLSAVGLAMARRSRIFDRLDAVLDAHRSRRAPGRGAMAAGAGLVLACVAILAALGPSARAHEETTSTSVPAGAAALPDTPELPELPALPAPAAALLNSLSAHRSVSWECESDGRSMKVELEGLIEFSEDYRRIVRMEDGARFRLETKQGRHRASVEAEPDADGQPVYDYRVGRRSRPFDAEAAAWLAETLDAVALEAGIDADARMQREYAQQGVRGALALLDRIDSEHGRSVYYCAFLDLDGPGDDEISEVLRRVRRDFESDYLQASVLIAYVDRHLHREAPRREFSACLAAVESDYEVGRVLKSGLDRPDRTPAELAVLLGAVDDLRSDYEAAQFLAAFRPEQLADAETRRAYFAALDGIGSDYEQANVLTTLARRAAGDDELLRACLDAAGRIDSDFEYARVVRALR